MEQEEEGEEGQETENNGTVEQEEEGEEGQEAEYDVPDGMEVLTPEKLASIKSRLDGKKI